MSLSEEQSPELGGLRTNYNTFNALQIIIHLIHLNYNTFNASTPFSNWIFLDLGIPKCYVLPSPHLYLQML